MLSLYKCDYEPRTIILENLISQPKIFCRERISSIPTVQHTTTYNNMSHNSNQHNNMTFTHGNSNHNLQHIRARHHK